MRNLNILIIEVIRRLLLSIFDLKIKKDLRYLEFLDFQNYRHHSYHFILLNNLTDFLETVNLIELSFIYIKTVIKNLESKGNNKKKFVMAGWIECGSKED